MPHSHTHPFGFLHARTPEGLTLSRRNLLKAGLAGFGTLSLPALLRAQETGGSRPPLANDRSVILLWMAGGPSHMDTFDLKPGHANGGPVKEIATSVPGIRITENLPGLAKHMKRLAIIRSMTTREADHARATYLMRTGRAPGGPIQYPTLGSLVSKELESPDAPLPRLGHPAQPEGSNVLMADGSVRFIRSTISERTMRALITRAGGEVIGGDF